MNPLPGSVVAPTEEHSVTPGGRTGLPPDGRRSAAVRVGPNIHVSRSRAGLPHVEVTLAAGPNNSTCRAARRKRAVLRAERARVKSLEGIDSIDPADPSDCCERAELRTVTDEEIARLPSRYRLAIVLCYLDGLTQEQAARRLSVDQDKEEDGFAHQVGKRPRKEPLFGGALQTMETDSDFAIGLISSPRWEQDTERKRRPSNDRVPGNKTER